MCFPDGIIIESTLVDKDNNYIVNANISTATKKTVSDNNGYFKIICNKDEIITISHLNFKTKYLKTDSIPKIISLENIIINIDDVIIYGGINNTDLSPNILIINDKTFQLNGNNHIEDIIITSSNLNSMLCSPAQIGPRLVW